MKIKVFIIVTLCAFSLIFLFIFVSNQDEKYDKKSKNQSNKNKGIAITLYDSNNNDEWYDTYFPKIKEMGAELEVVTIATVKNESDPFPINDPNIEDKLERLMRKSKQYGVKVSMIKPHLMTKESGDNFPRVYYNPNDINLFFSKWKDILQFYASFSKEYNVPFLSLSCETAYLSQNIYLVKWENIIKEIKTTNPHLNVTMAMSKDELDRELKYHEKGVKSLSEILDYVSLNMYPAVKEINNDNIKVSDNYFLKDGRQYGIIESIKKVKKYFNKNVLITETGATNLSARSNGYIFPLNMEPNNINPINQSQWINLVLNILFQMDEVKGVYLWHVNYPFQMLEPDTLKTIQSIYKKY